MRAGLCRTRSGNGSNLRSPGERSRHGDETGTGGIRRSQGALQSARGREIESGTITDTLHTIGQHERGNGHFALRSHTMRRGFAAGAVRRCTWDTRTIT